jgi:hypothetical protein
MLSEVSNYNRALVHQQLDGCRRANHCPILNAWCNFLFDGHDESRLEELGLFCPYPFLRVRSGRPHPVSVVLLPAGKSLNFFRHNDGGVLLSYVIGIRNGSRSLGRYPNAGQEAADLRYM